MMNAVLVDDRTRVKFLGTEPCQEGPAIRRSCAVRPEVREPGEDEWRSRKLHSSLHMAVQHATRGFPLRRVRRNLSDLATGRGVPEMFGYQRDFQRSRPGVRTDW